MSVEDSLFRLFKYSDPNTVLDMFKPYLGQCISEIDVRYAFGHVLAEDIYSPIDRPFLDISHVDGYAIRSIDTKGASSRNPISLKVVKGVDPRNAHEYTIKEGEAVFVETAYPLPRGADAVVPVESVRREGDMIYIYREVKRGSDVFRKGTDFRKGEKIASKGDYINPSIQKALMDLGIKYIKVFCRPRIAIIGVGSELTDEIVAPSTSKITASSSFFLKHILEYYGAKIAYMGLAKDDPNDLVSVINYLLRKRIDLIITIGGVSMGPRDFTWITIYQYYRPKIFFRGLKTHPGRSTSGTLVEGIPIINLPGLPQSTLSGTLFIILPIINYMYGRGFHVKLPFIDVEIEDDYVFDKYMGFYRLRFLKVNYSEGKAKIIRGLGSYHVSVFTRSDAFTIIEPGVKSISKGERIRAYYLEPIYKYNNTTTYT